MSATLVGDHCTCEERDPGGVDPGCPRHGSHPCVNAFRLPHEAGERGRGCCDHCVHLGGRTPVVVHAPSGQGVEW